MPSRKPDLNQSSRHTIAMSPMENCPNNGGKRQHNTCCLGNIFGVSHRARTMTIDELSGSRSPPYRRGSVGEARIGARDVQHKHSTWHTLPPAKYSPPAAFSIFSKLLNHLYSRCYTVRCQRQVHHVKNLGEVLTVTVGIRHGDAR